MRKLAYCGDSLLGYIYVDTDWMYVEVLCPGRSTKSDPDLTCWFVLSPSSFLHVCLPAELVEPWLISLGMDLAR